MNALSPKQRELLAVLMEQVDLHGCTPTIRWLCIAMNKSSSSTIFAQLEGLEKKNYLYRPPIRPELLMPTALAKWWWTEEKSKSRSPFVLSIPGSEGV